MTRTSLGGIYFALFILTITIFPIGANALTPITTCSELQDMQNDLTEDYVLANSINCAGFDPDVDGSGFIPVGTIGTPFEGSFDGDNFTISNLTIVRPGLQRVGLFGHVNGGTYRDVIITGSIEGQRRVASLIGSSDAAFNLTVTNVRSSANIISHGSIAAGIVGQAGGTMAFSNLVYSGTLLNESDSASTDNTGGIIGYADGVLNISSSTVSGNITATTTDGTLTDVGGIVGYVFDTATLASTSFTGNLTVRAQDILNVGGLVGDAINAVNISTSSVIGNITSTAVISTNGVGGLIGYPSGSGSINKSYATGTLTVTSDTVTGGIGGLVGYNAGIFTITDSYKRGNIIVDATSVTDGVGGIMGGSFNGHIIRTYAAGNIYIEAVDTINRGIAGLMGYVGFDSEVLNSFYSGQIYATTTTNILQGVGGIMGYVDGGTASTITNSYSAGGITVHGDSTTAAIAGLIGLVGNVGSSIVNSFSAMAIAATSNSSTAHIGAVIGNTGGITTTNNFYDRTLSTQGFCLGSGSDPAGCTPINNNTPYFKNNSTNPPLNAWNFSTIWKTQAASYPVFWLIPSPYPVVDVAPVLAEVTPVPTPDTDITPSYTFSSDEDGTISYGGSCSSAATAAVAGSNTITFDTLAVGTYADCTITVTDAGLNASSPLAVTSFTITAAPVVVAAATPVATPVGPIGGSGPVMLPPPPVAPVGPRMDPFSVFPKNRTVGNVGEDVKRLQKFLNDSGFVVARKGAGSPGKETSTYGAATKAAVIRFQKSQKIVPAVGYFGPLTRAVAGRLYR